MTIEQAHNVNIGYGYTFPFEIPEDKRTSTNAFGANLGKILSYIPIISTIFYVVMIMSFQKKEEKINPVFLPRFILSVASVGILLLPVDILETLIFKPALHAYSEFKNRKAKVITQ